VNTPADIFKKALEFLEEGKEIHVVTVVEAEGNTPAEAGKKMIVPFSGMPSGTIGGGGLEREAERHCRETEKRPVEAVTYDLAELGMTCGGRVTLLYEYFSSRAFFVLFGGGHVGSALAPILESLGYTAVIADNREGIIERHRNLGRTALRCSYEDISPVETYLSSGHCFIASHNHEYDTVILEQLLRREEPEYSYIGMIGSKNKVRQAFDELRQKGLAIPGYVYAPVGLHIGGGSPAEIAVSIAAEIVAVTYGKSVPHMRR
jgi:xanthine dehydrogenase accessory factor